MKFIFVLFFFSLHALSKPSGQDFIGVRTLEFYDTARKRPVLVELWYPVACKAALHLEEEEEGYWVYPKEARNAPYQETREKWPLILMSHGYRGDRRDRSWLAEKLVQHGYVVASVEHFGCTRKYHPPVLSLRFWDRPRDVSFALDELLKTEDVHSRIDTNCIGFIGYSLGGMTGLSLAGALAKDVKKIALHSETGIDRKLIESFDFSEAEKDFTEPRISAFLLLCPAIFVYPPESLKNVKKPIALVAAVGDEVLPHKEHAYQIIKNMIPRKLKLLRKEVSHYSFLNRVSEKGKKALKKHETQDPPCCKREEIHREVAEFTLDFFRERWRLKSQKS